MLHVNAALPPSTHQGAWFRTAARSGSDPPSGWQQTMSLRIDRVGQEGWQGQVREAGTSVSAEEGELAPRAQSQPGQGDICGVQDLPHLAVQYQGSRGCRLAARRVCIGVASVCKGHPTDLRMKNTGCNPTLVVYHSQGPDRPRKRGRGRRGQACVWSAKNDAKHLIAKKSPGSQRWQLR
jgi:hypothetical protein